MNTKLCSKCGETKELTAFSFASKKEGRRHSWCKECMKAYLRLYQQTHRAELNQKARETARFRNVPVAPDDSQSNAVIARN